MFMHYEVLENLFCNWLDIKKKYLEDFRKRDIYFFLGTRREAHIRRWKNPYSVIGVFYPPIEIQPEFDFTTPGK
jgi:hypothetical protein